MLKLTQILAISLSIFTTASYAEYCEIYDFSNLVVTGPQTTDDWQIIIEAVNSKNVVAGGMTDHINNYLEFPYHASTLSGTTSPLPLPLLTVKTVGLRHWTNSSWSYAAETPPSCKVDFLPNKCSVLKIMGEIKVIDANKPPIIVKPLSCEMTYLPASPFVSHDLSSK